MTGATYTTLSALLAGFDPVLGQEDPDMTLEVEAFLDALVQTQTIITLHSCLLDWGMLSSYALV